METLKKRTQSMLKLVSINIARPQNISFEEGKKKYRTGIFKKFSSRFFVCFIKSSDREKTQTSKIFFQYFFNSLIDKKK